MMFTANSYRKLHSDSPRSNIITKPKRATNRIVVSNRLPPVLEQPKSKTGLTMKVKELRSWLSELGEKNHEHYHRFHQRKSPSSSPPPGDDILGIQSKPSMASSCPSTAIIDDTNDPLFSASFSSDEDNSSTSSYQAPTRTDFSQRTSENPTLEISKEHVTSKDHLALLLKQAPRTQDGSSYSVGGFEDNRDDCDDLSVGTSQSTLFRDQILTKATLDAMSGSTGPPLKTLGEKLRALQQEDPKHDSKCEYHGNNEEESKGSADSLSIGPGVLVSKMATVFLNQRHDDPPPPAPRRKHVDLPAFLKASSAVTTMPPREDLSYANPPKTPTTTVGKGIRKFGGPRKTLVERRKEQLSQKFGETRSAVFVQKKTWGQKSPHGKYERTTRVEKVYKE